MSDGESVKVNTKYHSFFSGAEPENIKLIFKNSSLNRRLSNIDSVHLSFSPEKDLIQNQGLSLSLSILGGITGVGICLCMVAMKIF